MSTEAKAKELGEYCGMEELKEQYFYLRERCKNYAAEVKKDKYAIQYTEQNLKSDSYYLASNSFTINPQKVLRNISARRDIAAQKRLLKMKKLDLKQDKERYKEVVRQRDEIVKKIAKIHEEKKDEIQKGKEAKAKELGDRIRETPSRIIEGVKDKAKNTLEVGKSFVKGITGIETKQQNPREVDDDDGR